MKYCNKLICCLMLEIRKNFSKPQFCNAATVPRSCKATTSSSSCSRSCHVTTIFLRWISEKQTREESGSSFSKKQAKIYEKTTQKLSSLHPSHPSKCTGSDAYWLVSEKINMHRTFWLRKGAMVPGRVLQTSEAQHNKQIGSESKMKGMQLKSTSLAPTRSKQRQESSTESPGIC